MIIQASGNEWHGAAWTWMNICIVLTYSKPIPLMQF